MCCLCCLGCVGWREPGHRLESAAVQPDLPAANCRVTTHTTGPESSHQHRGGAQQTCGGVVEFTLAPAPLERPCFNDGVSMIRTGPKLSLRGVQFLFILLVPVGLLERFSVLFQSKTDSKVMDHNKEYCGDGNHQTSPNTEVYTELANSYF